MSGRFLSQKIILGCMVGLGLSFFSAVSAEEASPGLNLWDCYHLALKQSEKVMIQNQLIREAEGRFWQSLSGISPKATYSYSERYQDGRSGSNFTLSEIPESKFVFSQPLFSGFKEFASIAASRAEQRQQTHELTRAKQLLFVDVSDAFYLLLSYEDDLKALLATQKALRERVEELKKREELGRSRASEVASAQARLSRLDADLEQTRSEADVSRQLLEFLTGQKIEALDGSEKYSLEVNSLEDFLSKVENRPDIKALIESERGTHKQIAVVRSGYWPTVNLDGNYYQKRVGNATGVDWDTTLSIDVNVFDGGETGGEIMEAKAKARQAELRLKEARRNAILEVRNAHTNYQSAQRRSEALKKAYGAAQKNFELQLEDYRNNLVNNLDVLSALEDLQNAHRDFIQVHYQAKRLFWNLQLSVGEIPDDAR